ncbi:CDP-glycerol glycerophosphotransferase family protein [Saxibacter everestensis]|uniref:CDP-glycerol glycerophosphotransferase family protein n=1 Tax=Saxibacter everestensis TaxID=2909229 RepID=A0ABY8QVL4_9MICO|nr:CDP-glycerol glycerophosphotransferase family protein [Brevibacteriaceae bacterium ZFBP1038]
MSLFSQARSIAGHIGSLAAERWAARRVFADLGVGTKSTDDRFEVGVYFADSPVNIYQIRQWLGPFEVLAKSHSLGILCRNALTARELQAETTLPVRYSRLSSGLDKFFAENPLRVVFYVNQNTQNFQGLKFPEPAHVHLSHGESEKISMSSNQLKAYDFAFTAGQAARDRILSRLIDFEPARLIDVGRPQIDIPAHGPDLPEDDRTVVLYAPTWEGDAPAMSYSSVASHGRAVVGRLLSTGRHRVIYRPHPRTGVISAAARSANAEIQDLIVKANGRDPGANHLIDTGKDFGWGLAAADVCVCDISAVTFDWMTTAKPLLLTEPVAPGAAVDGSGVVGKLPLIAQVDADRIVELIDDLLITGKAAEYTELCAYHFGDTAPGESLNRFVAATEHVIRDRSQKLGS